MIVLRNFTILHILPLFMLLYLFYIIRTLSYYMSLYAHCVLKKTFIYYIVSMEMKLHQGKFQSTTLNPPNYAGDMLQIQKRPHRSFTVVTFVRQPFEMNEMYHIIGAPPFYCRVAGHHSNTKVTPRNYVKMSADAVQHTRRHNK